MALWQRGQGGAVEIVFGHLQRIQARDEGFGAGEFEIGQGAGLRNKCFQIAGTGRVVINTTRIRDERKRWDQLCPKATRPQEPVLAARCRGIVWICLPPKQSLVAFATVPGKRDVMRLAKEAVDMGAFPSRNSFSENINNIIQAQQ